MDSICKIISKFQIKFKYTQYDLLKTFLNSSWRSWHPADPEVMWIGAFGST